MVNKAGGGVSAQCQERTRPYAHLSGRNAAQSLSHVACHRYDAAGSRGGAGATSTRRCTHGSEIPPDFFLAVCGGPRAPSLSASYLSFSTLILSPPPPFPRPSPHNSPGSCKSSSWSSSKYQCGSPTRIITSKAPLPVRDFCAPPSPRTSPVKLSQLKPETRVDYHPTDPGALVVYTLQHTTLPPHCTFCPALHAR